ncbi:hypothetical protein AXK56_04140 [Tsukamurella pulmonis]|uniref:PTS system IIA component, Gat family n=1 Tax=Tsukamurella pulmonis TaxID=47312 RepID=A0A1H1DN47_9ACTN|nr:PTS sugar transporter subunit IIA [Tsukamurella pulmonis]KXO92276.1 hypothetical protein AXK56_04140 [Tsukamurella pulmonis]SDQ77648.1 PTS system IIA component, Gat family [Tsukamurella pulmonis]SUP21904.1 Mannitol-specific phosphotransferase enzyme IIA component [Tsukamurella pulmonis]
MTLRVVTHDTLLDFTAEDPATVIRAVGAVLNDAGTVTPDYVEAMLDRETQYPTGLATEPVAIAVPHATAGDAVLHSSIGFARLSPPVAFAEMGTSDGRTVDVGFVFALAVSPDEHLGTLTSLLRLAQEESDLLSEATVEAITAAIGRALR